VFHASYLRVHVPNDDQRFPGRLDNQVAEFETQEREWAIDRILSHKGSRADAEFKVKWKAGDITWLPFDQVDHLDTLRDYLDVLDVDDVSDLTDNSRTSESLPQLSHDVSDADSHVFLGTMGLGWHDHISQPPSSSSPSSTSTSHLPMSPGSPTTPLFRAQGDVLFVLVDRYRPGTSVAITLDQLRMYLQYDADLRGGTPPSTLVTPIGYDDFAVILNSNAGAGIQVAIVLEENEGVCVAGRPPTLAELVGLEAARWTAHASPGRDPREEAGGTWLDPRRSELMDHALWDNLECIKKQRAWHDRSVAERQAKHRRREDDEVMRPFAPSTSLTNAVAGPSNTNPPPAPANPPPPPPPTLPAPDPAVLAAGDEDEVMNDDDTEGQAVDVKGKGKGLGQIPKK
jgi:hypothetical protein